MKQKSRARVIGRTALVLALIALISVVAWRSLRGMPLTARLALANADQYELLSLNPRLSGPGFCGHEILGRTTITDPATRQKLNDALQSAALQSDGKMKSCFNPRHGIRVTHAGVTTDFAICFQCQVVVVWRGDKEIASFPISPSPQHVFNEVLQNANVPLPPTDD